MYEVLRFSNYTWSNTISLGTLWYVNNIEYNHKATKQYNQGIIPYKQNKCNHDKYLIQKKAEKENNEYRRKWKTSKVVDF